MSCNQIKLVELIVSSLVSLYAKMAKNNAAIFVAYS